VILSLDDIYYPFYSILSFSCIITPLSGNPMSVSLDDRLSWEHMLVYRWNAIIFSLLQQDHPVLHKRVANKCTYVPCMWRVACSSLVFNSSKCQSTTSQVFNLSNSWKLQKPYVYISFVCQQDKSAWEIEAEIIKKKMSGVDKSCSRVEMQQECWSKAIALVKFLINVCPQPQPSSNRHGIHYYRILITAGS
jgi:hypothetical protein